MANSRFGYVRSFEQPDTLLPNTYVVVRIDGKGFTKLTARYNFVKPNDTRGLGLMNAAAEAVMKELPDLVLAYGQSDEYSFVFPKDCQLFERRASKLTTLIVSVFTANYVFAWSTYFPDTPLTPPLPSFDGRAVCYPSELNVRDYLSWRQVDCHINNLFNTTFWALVQQGGMERRAAEQELSGTVASEKNEILFSRFGINYNNEPDIFKKGTVLYRDLSPAPTAPAAITTTTPAKTVQSPPPPLSHPQPKKLLPRPMSQPLHSTYPSLFQDTPPPMTSDPTTPRGPTFLSTSTTPSPPPPARDMSMPTLSRSSPDKLSLAYPQTFFPVSPPSNGSAAGSTSTMKSHLPSLTPIPLPPPTLKPSTRPPPSLSPPNPTSHTNFSPLPSPNPDATQTSSRSKNAVSHSASASLSRPTTSAPSSRPLPKRSPSMSILNFSPPQIPIRISSIPLDAPTRKLSLPSSKSYSVQRAEEKENTSPGRADKSRTPPLRTMKELPSPPAENDHVIRGAVMGSEPQEWTTSPTDLPQDRTTHSPPSEPPPRSSKRASSHSRLHSAPPSSSFFASTMAAADAILSPPLTSRDANADWPRRTSAANSASLSPTSTPQPPKGPQPPKKDTTPCSHTSTHHHIHHPQQRSSSSAKKSGGKIKDHMEEDGGWLSGSAAGGDGRPVEKSKTQREKERKKKMKARVVAEHVDIIKDGFWEKRPWILKDGGVM